ncbi:MAG TPA: hypothetical protein PKC14_04085, partial [Candidatus Absconditabacterales bacterium]|nr:hypothetical protein [Candidatus Absconditabacterales bacterium]
RGYKTDWSFQPMRFFEQTGNVITGSMSGEITLPKTLSGQPNDEVGIKKNQEIIESVKNDSNKKIVTPTKEKRALLDTLQTKHENKPDITKAFIQEIEKNFNEIDKEPFYNEESVNEARPTLVGNVSYFNNINITNTEKIGEFEQYFNIVTNSGTKKVYPYFVSERGKKVGSCKEILKNEDPYFHPECRPKEIAQIDNVSPRAKYVVSEYSCYECYDNTTKEMLSLTDGSKILTRASTYENGNKMQRTPSGDQFIFAQLEDGDESKGRLNITEKGNFPKLIKLSNDIIISLYVDKFYIYVKVIPESKTLATTDENYSIKIYDLSSLKQVY